MKKMIFAILAMCAVVGAQGRVLHNVYARDTMSLNGLWQTIIDPFDAGYYDYRLNVSPNGFFKNDHPATPGDHVEYDFVDTDVLRVPGDWNTQRPELFVYEGSVWYKRDFDYDLTPGNRLYVYFGAVNYHADVYLNGEKIGSHDGGFTPFNFDITDKVKPRDNYLIVRVNNERLPNGVPTVNSDWWNYGGITRDVMLVATPDISIDDYSVKLAPDVYDRLSIDVSLDSPVADKEITVEIPRLKVKTRLVTDRQGRASGVVKAKPELWSPESPRLYDVVISHDGERITDRIGFRHIATRGKEILLNGKPIFLRGISVHEEAPYRTGRCTGQADDSILLSWARELNCNFLRLAHYPHNEQMVRLAEQEGFLLWSEIPVYWTIHWDDPETLANARRQLRDNIDRDHNRCAIIVWSVANETPHSDARDAFLATLASDVRAADDERLLSMAMEVTWSDNNRSLVRDNMSQYVDIISFNNYLGWYGGRPADCDTRAFEIPYDKPVFISEFGGGAVAGRHGDASCKWTEEYQADLYRRTLAMYDRVDGFSGCSPWILMDFRSARRQNHDTQNFFNRKGIVSDQGVRKQAFNVLRDYYAGKR